MIYGLDMETIVAEAGRGRQLRRIPPCAAIWRSTPTTPMLSGFMMSSLSPFAEGLSPETLTIPHQTLVTTMQHDKNLCKKDAVPF